jgi:hypothetical protein
MFMLAGLDLPGDLLAGLLGVMGIFVWLTALSIDILHLARHVMCHSLHKAISHGMAVTQKDHVLTVAGNSSWK